MKTTLNLAEELIKERANEFYKDPVKLTSKLNEMVNKRFDIDPAVERLSRNAASAMYNTLLDIVKNNNENITVVSSDNILYILRHITTVFLLDAERINAEFENQLKKNKKK